MKKSNIAALLLLSLGISACSSGGGGNSNNVANRNSKENSAEMVKPESNANLSEMGGVPPKESGSEMAKPESNANSSEMGAVPPKESGSEMTKPENNANSSEMGVVPSKESGSEMAKPESNANSSEMGAVPPKESGSEMAKPENNENSSEMGAVPPKESGAEMAKPENNANSSEMGAVPPKESGSEMAKPENNANSSEMGVVPPKESGSEMTKPESNANSSEMGAVPPKESGSEMTKPESNANSSEMGVVPPKESGSEMMKPESNVNSSEMGAVPPKESGSEMAKPEENNIVDKGQLDNSGNWRYLGEKKFEKRIKGERFNGSSSDAENIYVDFSNSSISNNIVNIPVLKDGTKIGTSYFINQQYLSFSNYLPTINSDQPIEFLFANDVIYLPTDAEKSETITSGKTVTYKGKILEDNTHLSPENSRVGSGKFSLMANFSEKTVSGEITERQLGGSDIKLEKGNMRSLPSSQGNSILVFSGKASVTGDELNDGQNYRGGFAGPDAEEVGGHIDGGSISFGGKR